MAKDIEKCYIAMSQLLINPDGAESFRSQIEQEIRCIPVFDGANGTLPKFSNAVERFLTKYPYDRNQVFEIIFNSKIQGAAKHVLAAEPPTNWFHCKQRLKIHFRTTIARLQDIPRTEEIGECVVSTMEEL